MEKRCSLSFFGVFFLSFTLVFFFFINHLEKNIYCKRRELIKREKNGDAKKRKRKERILSMKIDSHQG
jgi:hypothetical protein